MAFSFSSLGQEIYVWQLVEKGYTDDAYTRFVSEVSCGRQVELNDGPVTHIQSKTSEDGEDGYLVFEYSGETYRVDVEDDSWDSGNVSEPYLVIAIPVNEVQYVRRKN